MFAKKLLCVAIGGALSAIAALPSAASPAVNNRAIEIVGAGATSDPLIAVEANRSAIINRLVAEQTASLAAAGVSAEAFRSALESLRADQLLAASLVNSVEAIAAIVADAPVSGSALQRFIAISPRDAGSLDGVPAANAYLVRDGDTLSIVPAGQLQAGSQLVGYFTSAMSTTVVNVGGSASDVTPKDGSGTGAGSWIGYTAGGNQASGINSAVAAGSSNIAGNFGSFVGAGTANQATGISALVIGGFDNRATAIDSLVGAGAGNRANGLRSIIVGGGYNRANGDFSFLGGGGRDGIVNTPAGTDTKDNLASGAHSVVVGGMANTASGEGSFVGGGGRSGGNPFGNTASGRGSVVVGGFSNVASGIQAFVGGGYSNVASGTNSFISGGFNNSAAGDNATALGEAANAATANSFVFSDGTSFTSTVARTFNIRAQNDVRIDDSTSIRMGSTVRQNITLWGVPTTQSASYGIGVQSSNMYFRVDGTTANAEGFRFFRGGLHNDTAGNAGTGGLLLATLDRQGTFQLPNALDQHIRLRSASGLVQGMGGQTNTVYLRTNDNVAFYVGGTHNDNTLDPGGGTILATMQVGAGSATVGGNVRALSFTSTSDKNQKSSFLPVDAKAILAKVAAMPITSWVYNAEKSTGVRHIGPVAQDFANAFKVGYDDKTISTVDASGVAFAAIKGLNQLVKEKDSEIAALRRELEAIKKKLGM